MFGVLLLALFVRDHRGALPPAKVSPTAAFGLLRGRRFRTLTVAAVLLGLSTVGDGFVYLILQRRDDLPVLAFPLLAVGTSLAYLLLSIPAGRLADRVGRWPVILAGYAALLAVYLLLAAGQGPLPLILLLYGAFYAGTDGVLMALAGSLLPEALRTSGLALIQSGQALAYLGSSVLFGLAWQFWGAPAACLAAAGAVAVALPVSAILLKGRDS
ncbi:hypothetical protein Cs7R123_46230 [Catellatospora sp. TT07R-123]|uniref:MFS transporter n=1 Tax=Catellatospora sp. TT07R-123 TaxID=2733863 RepID=UPI001B1C5779|nr:MFS transporter [Catellatospora sp. TT07R-123]GHJ47281.1 hypothetical protein Cs7R123_46230 [Catellatospora sp. TT07R-123]